MAIASGHLKKVSPADVKCVSETFAIPKKHGPGEETHRLIINLQNVNAWIQTEHFQLPSLQKILPYLRKGLWGVVVDLKAAYTHMPLSLKVKPFVAVHLDGIILPISSVDVRSELCSKGMATNDVTNHKKNQSSESFSLGLSG